MSEAARTDRARVSWLTAAAWRALLRDRPVVPLTGLLVVLVIALQVANPGMVTVSWAGVILRQSVPLAILAGCQTLAMLTGGIDLSVAAIASMSGFVTATFVHSSGGWVQGMAIALVAAALAGLVTGIGVGVFRVHPLIMTLGMSFVVLGLSNWWQLQMVQTGAGVPEPLHWLGVTMLWDILPLQPARLRAGDRLHPFGLRRTGYGRLLFAIGDNPIAARLSGARSWQVLIVLYVISAVLAAIAGFVLSGVHQHGQRVARRHVPAAVRRGGGDRRDLDHGRPRRLRRNDRRDAHPDGRQGPALTVARPAGGDAPDPLRVDHRLAWRPPTPA